MKVSRRKQTHLGKFTRESKESRFLGEKLRYTWKFIGSQRNQSFKGKPDTPRKIHQGVKGIKVSKQKQRHPGNFLTGFLWVLCIFRLRQFIYVAIFSCDPVPWLWLCYLSFLFCAVAKEGHWVSLEVEQRTLSRPHFDAFYAAEK